MGMTFSQVASLIIALSCLLLLRGLSRSTLGQRGEGAPDAAAGLVPDCAQR